MRVLFLFFLLVKLMFALPHELLNKQNFTDNLTAEYLVDKKAKMDIRAALDKRAGFLKAKRERLDVGYEDAVWFRFVFSSKISDVSRWMLYHPIIPLDRLEFYCIRSSGEVQKFVAGDLIEFQKKQVPSRYQTLFFELEPNETVEIFAKAQNQGRITSNFVLLPAAAFIEKNSNENLAWGIYFGFFLAMIFYNFWLFLSLKDKLYGVYTANITAMFAMMLVAYGFVQPMFSEGLIPYVDVSSRFFGALAPTMFVLFLMLFFETEKKYKNIHRLLIFALALLVLHSVLYAVDTVRATILKVHFTTTFIISFFYVFFILFISLFMVYKKERWAWYILAVSAINSIWVLLLVFSFVGVVDESGIVEKVGLAKNFLHVGILSMMLGFRFSWLKQEKEISQKLFTEQSKRSIAGDTVSNITHQWKQPIAELSAVLSAVKADIRLGRLEPEALQKDCDKAFFILQKMASSVDFFQDFFRLESKNEKLNPDKAIDMALDVYARSFEQLGVTVKLSCDGDSFVYADSNGLLQVFSVILQNSKEAFRYKNIDNPTVGISVSGQNNLVVIEFIDNGGGCDGAVLKNIFNPFFGTKKESTGSGLYLAKIIVEQKMGGSITAYNRDGGLCVTIKLPAYFGDNL